MNQQKKTHLQQKRGPGAPSQERSGLAAKSIPAFVALVAVEIDVVFGRFLDDDDDDDDDDVVVVVVVVVQLTFDG